MYHMYIDIGDQYWTPKVSYLWISDHAELLETGKCFFPIWTEQEIYAFSNFSQEWFIWHNK